jgi:hypothetical protein
MTNTRCFNPWRIAVMGADGVNRAAARSNAMHYGNAAVMAVRSGG